MGALTPTRKDVIGIFPAAASILCFFYMYLLGMRRRRADAGFVLPGDPVSPPKFMHTRFHANRGEPRTPIDPSYIKALHYTVQEVILSWPARPPNEDSVDSTLVTEFAFFHDRFKQTLDIVVQKYRNGVATEQIFRRPPPSVSTEPLDGVIRSPVYTAPQGYDWETLGEQVRQHWRSHGGLPPDPAGEIGGQHPRSKAGKGGRPMLTRGHGMTGAGLWMWI